MSSTIAALCSDALSAAVRARATEEGVTVSDVVREALAAHLQRSGHLARFFPQAAAHAPPVRRPSARAKHPSGEQVFICPGCKGKVLRGTPYAPGEKCLVCTFL